MAGSSMFSLTHRVALVTGSSRGIGFALARALGRAGATVVLNARTTDALELACNRLRDDGVDAYCRAGDITDAVDVERIVSSATEEVGPIDVLVNNAGVQHRAPILDFPVEEFRRLLDLNLVAAFTVAQQVGRSMVGRGRGKIINICSVQAELGRAGVTPYAASKGGLKLLTRGLCAELAPHGIQVNAIAPGYFATELTQALVDDPDFSRWVEERTPAGRWGSVDELGGAVVFLASDASSYVNGHMLVVDGGMTAVI